MSVEDMELDDQETAEPEDPAPAFGAAAAHRADPPRPEVQRPAERPRFQHAPNKQQGEGHEAMRRSAAVGEDYLNELLVGGLLEVPNVEARPAVPDDGVPAKRWGRSRMPIFLLIWIVTLGGVGALAWYVVIPYIKQKSEYKVSDELVAQIARGRLEDYVAAQEELGKALQKNSSNPLAAAYACEVQAMAHLVYGAGKREDMDASIAAAADLFKDKKPEAAGQHQLAVARAAQAVAAALKAPDAVPALLAAQKEIEKAKTIGTDDGTLLWLDGVVKQELGDREGARAAFETASNNGLGPPMSLISLADMWLDEGNAKGALAGYESVMALAPNHPYAVLGRALVKIEQHGDANAAMQDLNVGLATATGTRLMAWKRLVLGIVYAKLEDYEKSKVELEGAAASGLTEPRFLSRIALARLDQGNVVEAVRLRTLVRTSGDKVKDPLSTLLGAELLLATGLPEDALGMIEGRTDARARIARGRALLDAGKPGDAEKEFAAVLVEAPEDLKANAFRELSRVQARSGQKEALEALQKLARQSVSTAPRAVLGEAYAILGRRDDARRELEASLEGNPLAYRARVRLAEVYLADGRAEEAEKALRAALDQAPGYLPAHAMLGRSLLSGGKLDEALDELKIVLDAGRATWADELAIAQALAGGDQKDLAREALLRAKDKGAPNEELARVAAMIDEELAKEFGGGSAPKRRGR
jgi:tetratricopeptide (TPR) repeat protein